MSSFYMVIAIVIALLSVRCRGEVWWRTDLGVSVWYVTIESDGVDATELCCRHTNQKVHFITTSQPQVSMCLPYGTDSTLMSSRSDDFLTIAPPASYAPI